MQYPNNDQADAVRLVESITDFTVRAGMFSKETLEIAAKKLPDYRDAQCQFSNEMIDNAISFLKKLIEENS